VKLASLLRLLDTCILIYAGISINLYLRNFGSDRTSISISLSHTHTSPARVGLTRSGWTFSSGHWLGLGLSLVGWIWVVVLWVGFGLLSCWLGCVCVA